MNLMIRHATYMTMMRALGREVKPYREWLESLLVSTEQLLVIERETNERLSELVLDLSRDNARLEAMLADNAALVAMPQAAYEAVDGGLASMESVTLSHALRNRPLQGSWTNEQD